MAHQNYQRLIIGYHGCDEDTCQKVLGGRENLRPSENKWDWLGTGIYFWEYGPERALDFAKEQKERKDRRQEPFGTPAVLGAMIHLGHCFNLFDVRFTRMLRDVHPPYIQMLQDRGYYSIPSNHEDCIIGYFRPSFQKERT